MTNENLQRKIDDGLRERFWEKVDRGDPGECWEWQAATTPDGYGNIRNEHGEMEMAHRVTVRLDGRELGDKLALHHCDNPPCVNPEHIYVGTRGDNQRDAYDRGGKEPLAGESNPDASVTADEVVDIREAYDAGGVSYAELGDEYGLSTSAVGYIVTGVTWPNAGGPIQGEDQ